jgi:transmembrane sensor
MPNNQNYYQQLLVKYINHTCTPAEVEEVMQFLQQDAANRLLLQQLRLQFEAAMEQQQAVPETMSNNLRRRLTEKIQPARVLPLYKHRLFRIAAAVLIMIGLGAGSYVLFFGPAPVKVAVTKTNTQPVPVAAPGKAMATITLANGEQIVLDSNASGVLTQQGTTVVTRTEDGRLIYSDSLTIDDSRFTQNTLNVPRGGGLVSLTLTDGTRVWVNTASVLKYPAAFTSNERIVELTGEAYFEVAHDRQRPFRVRTKNMTIQVLGTAFNVNSYDDDEQQNVVLVNGSVALTVPDKTGMVNKQLAPGQLAGFEPATRKLSVTAVNTEEYVSWRKGYLIFRQTSLEQIIRRLGRYYDVQVNTDVLTAKKETFSGRLDMGKGIDDVMQVICMGSPFVYLPQEKKLILKD